MLTLRRVDMVRQRGQRMGGTVFLREILDDLDLGENLSRTRHIWK